MSKKRKTIDTVDIIISDSITMFAGGAIIGSLFGLTGTIIGGLLGVAIVIVRASKKRK